MQKEFNQVCGFKEWYAEKQPKMQSDKTMKVLNNKRTMTIHRQPVLHRARVKVGVSEHLTISDSWSMVITRADGTVERRESKPTPPPAPAKPPKAEMTTEWRWYFDELPEKDVVTVCEEHLVKLETLIVECESLFTS